MPRIHVLVAEDNGVCVSQARFTPVSGAQVQVLASIGASQYVDRVVPIDEARKMWTDLTRHGWTRPRNTPILTERALKAVIYG